MNASSLLKKHVKYCRNWTLKNANFIKSRGEAKVATCLDEGDLSALCILPNALQKLALYYGMKGSLAVIDRDDGGWAAIDRSISYSYWRVAVAAGVTFFRLNQRECANSISLYHEVPLAASLFCYALVHDLEEWRRNLWSILTRAVVTPGAITANYWRDQGAYELFVLQYFNQEMPDAGKTALPELLRDHDLGPYQAVLDHWTDPLGFEVALQEICNYHCANLMQKSSRDPWPPFSDPPFDLVPYEIHAIKKHRVRLGLEMPTVDHPQLATALAARETGMLTPYCDEVTERVQQLLTLLT